MTEPDPFLLHLPPEVLDKPLMIEASAGTGKTYTLTRLVLAYLLYKNIPIEKMLVITFTRNATAELRDRMARLVRENLADPHLPQEIKTKLMQISADFDSLHITTINSFLQQIFQNNSMEIAVNPLLRPTEDSSRLTETAYDYFRRFTELFEKDRRMQISLQAFTALAKKKNHFGSFEALKNFSDCIPWLTDNILNLPFLEEHHIFPAEDESEKAWMLEKEYIEGKGAVYTIFQAVRCTPNSGLLQLGLTNEIMKGADSITQLLILLGTHKSLSPWEKLCKESIRKKHPHLQDLYDILRPLSRAENNVQKNPHLAAMASYFLRHFQHHTRLILKEKQERFNIMRMEDSTMHLYKLMKTDSNRPGIQKLRRQYYAVLIDEFQDTSHFQWTILHKLFQPQKNDKHTYALIGDPKQLIYYFRGITPQTYADAKQSLPPDRIFQMQNNFRSHQNVISCVNFWFSRLFASSLHGYVCVQAGNKNAEYLYSAAHSKQAGITFLTFEDAPEEPLGNGKAKEISYKLCAQQIIELLNNENYRLIEENTGKQRRISPRDIACLVSSHQEGKDLKNILDKRGIPNTLLENKTSIYETEEYEHILLFLKVLARPDSRPLRMRILLSPLFALTPEQILPTPENLPRLEEFFILFNTWRMQADNRKISRVFDQLFYQYGYFERILAQGGERRFVNMRHLVSIILREERTAGINSGPNYLYQRLKTLKEEKRSEDQAKIRLETDDDAVRILTIHQAKGLEYSLVFGIFGITGIPAENTDYVMQKNQKPILDLSLHTEHSAPHLQETLHENMRKFYVLATRAKSCLFLPLVVTNKSSYYSYALSYLTDTPFNKDLSANDKKIYAATAPKFYKQIQTLAADPEQKFQCLKLEQNSESFIPRKTLAQEEWEELSAAELKHFEGFNHRIRHISSYTSLWHSKESEEEDDHIDEIILHHEDSSQEEKDLNTNPLNLSGGASLGNAFHAVMEALPFGYADTTLEDFLQNPHVHDITDIMISRHMSVNYHYDREYIKTVKTMVWNSLNTPISALGNLRLACLADSEKLHEVEFLLHIPEDCLLKTPSLQTEVKNGYLRGFLDLIFIREGQYFVLDWKTTRLGADQNAYNAQNLSKAMTDHGYDMQALIYSYALRQYLQTKLERDEDKIGGVIYLFSRGANPAYPSDGLEIRYPQKKDMQELFGKLK